MMKNNRKAMIKKIALSIFMMLGMMISNQILAQDETIADAPEKIAPRKG